MNQEDKKKKYARLLKQLASTRKARREKDLSDHDIYVEGMKKGAALFDKLLFQAIMEQAEGLSLAFGKPHSYQPEKAEVTRLSREAYDTLEKSAILRPTRVGPLTLIS